ncbi:hypothetical protein BC835DRAFT_858160 [Cytidiella melzeri]|nr:hypothetical protein BC835DRAFT_858160 [Cytidiella melzeri]
MRFSTVALAWLAAVRSTVSVPVASRASSSDAPQVLALPLFSWHTSRAPASDARREEPAHLLKRLVPPRGPFNPDPVSPLDRMHEAMAKLRHLEMEQIAPKLGVWDPEKGHLASQPVPSASKDETDSNNANLIVTGQFLVGALVEEGAKQVIEHKHPNSTKEGSDTDSTKEGSDTDSTQGGSDTDSTHKKLDTAGGNSSNPNRRDESSQSFFELPSALYAR